MLNTNLHTMLEKNADDNDTNERSTKTTVPQSKGGSGTSLRWVRNYSFQLGNKGIEEQFVILCHFD